MARGRFNKRGRGGRSGGGGGGKNNSSGWGDNRQPSDPITKVNARLEEFYNTLDIVPAGEQRDAFWAALRRELPNSFRFTGSKGHALGVRDNLVTRFFPLISKISHEGKPVELPVSMPWYPEGLAYSMTTPKNVVRKYEPFKEFQRFLVSETGVGNISRQEHVSMIPPLLMDIRPEHTVLDLCAAPGSKSAQLIEAIHAGEEERVAATLRDASTNANGNGAVDGGGEDTYDYGRPTGLLIANDVNYQRAQMLIHQVKRLNSPNLIVTNHDATMFPSIELPGPPTQPGQQKRGKYLKFDRILADVPCSGDGTARKNPNVWKDWTPQNGLGLYITQVRILTRALQMLKVGGRVVYSTCSMNPVENEAVVSSAIERCGGVAKVRLLDCLDQLPGLVRSPGLTDWSIMNRGGQMFESFAEAVQFATEESKIVPGMFAPEEAEHIPLQYCMRVYPHQQDTGGFFIAVLEKLSEIRAKPESEAKCMKKDWVFTTSVEPSATTATESTTEQPSTLFQELLEEVDNPTPLPQVGTGSASPKRKAEEPLDELNGSKRVRVDESSPGDLISASDRSLPPSVALAVDVSAAVASTPADSPAPAQQRMQNARRRNADDAPQEESFKYLSPAHPELQSIFKFYELHHSFPRDRFLVRNPAGDPVKGIYYSSQMVKDILTTNEGRGMKFVHGGVKMFMKQDAQGHDICRWRIQTEGLPIIEGWVGASRNVVLTKRPTLRKLLVEMFPRIDEQLGEILEPVRELSMGCCVLRVQQTDNEDGFSEPLVLPLWRSMHSLNLMLPKEDRRAMLLRIYNEDVELINHSDAQRKVGASKGSRPAEADARETERRMLDAAATTSSALETSANGVAAVPAADINENGIDLAAEALGQDIQDAHNAAEAQALAQREQPDVKVGDAMPERQGEVDEANTFPERAGEANRAL